ncbi:hypothetical protein BDY19DRAFT_407327 [Irpex rosettiformis]|uniref:Uncharacterized protein n=1 Tax=Irpex rosettiformis TaxID=378272 RepID=A0ACB8UFP0_9APHY|nr:hypothetical protein BDY19DRAFT_407327 [Irpex rosettiformis]
MAYADMCENQYIQSTRIYHPSSFLEALRCGLRTPRGRPELPVCSVAWNIHLAGSTKWNISGNDTACGLGRVDFRRAATYLVAQRSVLKVRMLPRIDFVPILRPEGRGTLHRLIHLESPSFRGSSVQASKLPQIHNLPSLLPYSYVTLPE